MNEAENVAMPDSSCGGGEPRSVRLQLDADSVKVTHLSLEGGHLTLTLTARVGDVRLADVSALLPSLDLPDSKEDAGEAAMPESATPAAPTVDALYSDKADAAPEGKVPEAPVVESTTVSDPDPRLVSPNGEPEASDDDLVGEVSPLFQDTVLPPPLPPVIDSGATGVAEPPAREEESEPEELAAAEPSESEVPEDSLLRYGEPLPDVEWASDLPATWRHLPEDGGDAVAVPPASEPGSAPSSMGVRVPDATPGAAPLEKPEAVPEAAKPSGFIRYTCNRCGTPGQQNADKIGTIVTCSSCGKAMRLTLRQ